MGNGSSHEALGPTGSNRNAKSRHSTRSLPDSSRASRGASASTSSSNAIAWPSSSKAAGGRQVNINGANSQNTSASAHVLDQSLWRRDAGPYYLPSQPKTNKGARSLDGGQSWHGKAAYPYQQSQMPPTPAWSDVASDMYRVKPVKQHHRDARNYEDTETMSDFQTSGRASYHRRSSKSNKKARGNASGRDANVGYYRGAGDSDVPVASLKHSRSDYGAAAASFNATLNDYGLSPADSSTDSPSRSFHATLAKVAEESPPVPSGPPPRPPKPIQMRPEVNEYWIDGSPSKQRVTFGSGQQKKQLSVAIASSSPEPPPRSPGSQECDKLVIESLRAELASERRLKREAEKNSEECKKEFDQMTAKIADLEQKLKSTMKSGKNGLVSADKKRVDELEVKVTELNGHVGRLESERTRLKTEFDQQKNLYDKVLDDVAAKIVVYMKQQENIDAERQSLQKKISQLEWENRLLKAQLKADGVGTGSGTTTLTRLTVSSIASNSNKLPPPPVPPKTVPSLSTRISNGAAAEESDAFRLSTDSLISITSRDMICDGMIPNGHHHHTATSSSGALHSSPMSNGGEALCSRPESFLFDLGREELKPKFAIKQQSLRFPPPKRNPLGRSTSDDDDEDEVRNFAATSVEEITRLRNSMLLDVGRGTFPPPPTAPNLNIPEIRNPPPSKSANGSADTLCEQNGTNEKAETASRSPILVNMLREICIPKQAEIFREKFATASKLGTKIDGAKDDGYSTMSSEFDPLYAIFGQKLSNLQKDSSQSVESLEWDTLVQQLVNSQSSSGESGIELDSSQHRNRRWFSEEFLQILPDSAVRSLLDSKGTRLRRVASDSKLAVRISADRLRKFLVAFGRRRRQTAKSGCENPADRSLSSCDFTPFERELLMENEVEGREGLCDMADFQLETSFRADFYSICPPPDRTDTAPKPSEMAVAEKLSGFLQNLHDSSFDSDEAMDKEIFLQRASTSSSFTTESSEDDEHAATVEAWLKQLKMKSKANPNGRNRRNRKLEVVRYSPPGQRPSILKQGVFRRFGNQERAALAMFDFLDQLSDISSSAGSKKRLKVAPPKSTDRRRSRSLTQMFESSGAIFDDSSDLYENLPFHERTRSQSGDLAPNRRRSGIRQKVSSDSSSSLNSPAASGSYCSSLMLSDANCGPGRSNNDQSFSSSSSLSFHG